MRMVACAEWLSLIVPDLAWPVFQAESSCSVSSVSGMNTLLNTAKKILPKVSRYTVSRDVVQDLT